MEVAVAQTNPFCDKSPRKWSVTKWYLIASLILYGFEVYAIA